MGRSATDARPALRPHEAISQWVGEKLLLARRSWRLPSPTALILSAVAILSLTAAFLVVIGPVYSWRLIALVWVASSMSVSTLGVYMAAVGRSRELTLPRDLIASATLFGVLFGCCWYRGAR